MLQHKIIQFLGNSKWKYIPYSTSSKSEILKLISQNFMTESYLCVSDFPDPNGNASVSDTGLASATSWSVLTI